MITNVVLRIIGGVVIVAIGAYLMLNGHQVGGGWTIFGGIMFGAVSLNKESDNDY